MNYFEELDKILEAQNSPIVPHLRKGLDEAYIISEMKTTGLALHPDMLKLYSWHDGIEGSFSQSFWGNIGAFITFDQSIQQINNLGDKNWQYKGEVVGSYLFPFTVDDYLFFCLNPESSYWGSIFIISPGFPIVEPIIIFDSITSMLQTTCDCFKYGAYYVEGDYLEIDVYKQDEYAKKYNPNSDFWEGNW
jgi:hypothetical protein